MDLIIPESGLIIWQALGFIVLLIILAKFAWKPILAALEEREGAIENSLRSAEIARTEMANLVAENERLLLEARIERDNIIRKANDISAKIVEQARDDASKVGAKMIEDAKAVIENEKLAAITDIKIQVAEISLEVAEKLMRRNLSAQGAQKELVKEFVKDLKLN
jgi:F-type H+-transporting ATPase subunit b